MKLDLLQSNLHQQLIEHATQLNLDAGAMKLSYVLNWGGFVNASFSLTDGNHNFHIKVSQSAESDESLRRWCKVHHLLELNYHAPKILLNFQMNGTGREVLVFEHINGASPKSMTVQLAQKVLPVLSRLHTDATIAEQLSGGTIPERTYADCYKATFHERFTEDLALIENNLPPFVNQKCFDWMKQTAEQLLKSVKSSTEFQRKTHRLAHGDLWLNNVLVDKSDNFWILDWDDLAISDPAMDLTMLLGPSVEDIRPFEITRRTAPDYPIDNAMESRLKIYSPARLLDWVIDPLADYIEAESAPAVADEVRSKNKLFHIKAKTAFESQYASFQF